MPYVAYALHDALRIRMLSHKRGSAPDALQMLAPSSRPSWHCHLEPTELSSGMRRPSQTTDDHNATWSSDSV